MLFGKPPYETPDVKQTYKRIKMNEYQFPDIPCSEEAKDLIDNILQLDPSKRLSLDEILQHPFLMNGPERGNIPKSMPLSTLACPPSANYLAKFKADLQKDNYARAHPPTLLRGLQEKKEDQEVQKGNGVQKRQK